MVGIKTAFLTWWPFSLQVNVRVTTLDAELEFSFHPNTKGSQLFEQVCSSLSSQHI